MAELKTQRTRANVVRFLGGVDETRRADCKALANIMRDITGEKPTMWGTSIVGFGNYHYRYASGREGDWFPTGFSPRKRDLTLYVMAGSIASQAADAPSSAPITGANDVTFAATLESESNRSSPRASRSALRCLRCSVAPIPRRATRSALSN